MNTNLTSIKEMLRKRRRLSASELKIELGATYLCCYNNKILDIACVLDTDDGPKLVGSSWPEGEGLTDFNINDWEFFLDANALAGADIRDVIQPLFDEIKNLKTKLEKFQILAEDAKKRVSPQSGMLVGPMATYNGMKDIIEAIAKLA